MNVIRAADDKDIPKLVEIAGSCFPHSVNWSPDNQRAYRRWDFSIHSGMCEVWIYENEAGIQGFSLNILNEKDWISTRSKFYLSRFEKFIFFLKNPKKGYFLIRKNFDRPSPINLSESPRFITAPRLFIDLFAVTPNNRRKGVATALLTKNIERANDLDRYSVAYNVDKNNLAMLSLMEKHEYKALSEDRRQIIFAKHVKTSDNRWKGNPP